MANYTSVEIRAFRKKDLLNSRMSAIKAVSIVNEGSAKTPKTILKQADEFYDWVQQDQDKVDELDKGRELAKEHEDKKKEIDTQQPDSDMLPKPNLAQKKVLDVIFEKLGAKSQQEKVTVVKSVLRWSFAVHDGSKVLPSRVSSVDEFLTWLKENTVE